MDKEEEKQLKDLFKVKVPIDVIAAKLSRKPNAVIIKCKRLKLEVVVAKGYTTTTIKFILHHVLVELEVVGVEKKITPTTTSNLTLPEEAMRQKIRRLGLEVVGAKVYRTTTSISMPKELPSVEEALKLLAAISGLSGTVLGILWGRKHEG